MPTWQGMNIVCLYYGWFEIKVLKAYILPYLSGGWPLVFLLHFGLSGFSVFLHFSSYDWLLLEMLSLKISVWSGLELFSRGGITSSCMWSHEVCKCTIFITAFIVLYNWRQKQRCITPAPALFSRLKSRVIYLRHWPSKVTFLAISTGWAEMWVGGLPLLLGLTSGNTDTPDTSAISSSSILITEVSCFAIHNPIKASLARTKANFHNKSFIYSHQNFELVGSNTRSRLSHYLIFFILQLLLNLTSPLACCLCN